MDHEIKLNQLSTSALYNALTQTQPKGRSDMRIHAKIMAAMKKTCMVMMDEMNGSFKGGTLTISEDGSKYLGDVLDERIKAGLPGQFVDGYAELDELVADINKKIPDPPAEKKADEPKK